MNVITLDIMVKNAESKKEYKNKLLEMNQVAPVQVRIMEIEWLDEFSGPVRLHGETGGQLALREWIH